MVAGVLPMIYHTGSPLGQGQNPGTAPGDSNPLPGPGPIVADPGPPSSPGSRNSLAGPGGSGTPEVGPFPSAAPPLTNGERGFIRVSDFPLSMVPTASAWPDDAERGSFPAVRRSLENHQLPPAEMVHESNVGEPWLMVTASAAPAPVQPTVTWSKVADAHTSMPWMPLTAPRLLPSEDDWLPERWREMAIEMMASPFDAEGTAVVLGRSGGPAFRRSEVLRLVHLAGIATTVAHLPPA